MKLSDLDKIEPIRVRLRELLQMRQGLIMEPPYTARMKVGSNQLEVATAIAETFVQEEIDSLTDRLNELGVQNDIG